MAFIQGLREKLRFSKGQYLLAMIFLIVLAVRLYYSFQTPYFSESHDYLVLRQVEHIKETGFPIIDDPLSYSGRTYIGSPAFYYILAFFNLFLPMEIIGKIVINLFASLLVLIVYLLAKEISENENAALFSAFVSGFIPVFFSTTFNSFSVYALFFPLMFFAFYCFINIEKRNYLYLYLGALLLLALISPLVILLVFGFLFYIMLIKLDKMKQSRAEIEVILTSTFFIVWFLFLVYKKAFLFHGYSVIWQNIPGEILMNYFSDINILSAIYQIGSIPLIYGAYAITHHIYRPTSRKVCLFSSFAFSILILLWLKLIELPIGLICFGIISVILFARFYKLSFDYIKDTRFAKLSPIFFVFFTLALITTSFVPSFAYADKSIKETINDDEYGVLLWFNEHTDNSTVIASTLEEGDFISSIARRKNMADDNFLLINNPEEIYSDVKKIYTSSFETDALEVLDKYHAAYIYFSPRAKKEFGVKTLKYADDPKCFGLVYNKTVQVYKLNCRLEEIKG